MTAPAIHVDGIQKSFGELAVLRGVDFDVAEGSVYALLGANRAGKTSLVRILSTLARADGGSAQIAGFDVSSRAAEVRAAISLTGHSQLREPD